MSQYHDEACHYADLDREERPPAHFSDLLRDVSDRYYLLHAEKMALQAEVARLKRENESLRGTLNEIASRRHVRVSKGSRAGLDAWDYAWF